MQKLMGVLLTSAVVAFAAVGIAKADYPEKPVSFIVPFPPGDMEDVLTRMIAEDFQAKYGQAAAVVNKPGGGGGPFPGAVEVATAPADGYTIGSFVVDVPVIGPDIGISDLNPNPFEPVGIFLTYPFVIATSKDAPYQSMQELAEYAKSNDVVLGHFGSFLLPTQATLALAKKMGFSYASDAGFDALDCNTLASGDVDVMNTTMQQVLPCLDDVTLLASVTEERISTAPDTPTVSELDPALDISLWNGLFVHKDTPADVREKIAAAAKETIASERAQEFARETGAQIYWKDAEKASAQIEADMETVQEVGAILEN
jgi:tripartite-type tricarboxylate transporter receptor subunit TctC